MSCRTTRERPKSDILRFLSLPTSMLREAKSLCIIPRLERYSCSKERGFSEMDVCLFSLFLPFLMQSVVRNQEGFSQLKNLRR